MWRCRRLIMGVAAAAVAGCGSASGQPAQPGIVTPAATATATATPCQGTSPAARAAVGAAQALSVIPVRVLATVPATVAIMDLGSAACVNVGVSQRVSLHVRARIPPLPVETLPTAPLLSDITVTPAVPSSATAPRPGTYTLTFTAQAPGSTAITYLAATCTLSPGAC
ncbi:MAG: hypothetical protein DLM65_13440 [Candidatus Aeolococcus gillhamiae]|uniref:Uncharacterized protein n=1 Tax=Candidatus Aeolococcus gillhamiae TaxID=3127015 RepID=A0A2W5YZ10_9BACT|nr:MAG: hypothetical protein DLM65_13440 [Candidatus Dormibacter sp. RRmetagenome_bin12]